MRVKFHEFSIRLKGAPSNRSADIVRASSRKRDPREPSSPLRHAPYPPKRIHAFLFARRRGYEWRAAGFRADTCPQAPFDLRHAISYKRRHSSEGLHESRMDPRHLGYQMPMMEVRLDKSRRQEAGLLPVLALNSARSLPVAQERRRP